MTPDPHPDAITASDTVMVKADALIHRHRSHNGPKPEDDLPVLEDILGEELPVLEDIAEPAQETIELAAPAASISSELEELKALLAIAEGERDELLARQAEENTTREARDAAAEARIARLESELTQARTQSQATRMQTAEHLIDFDAHLAQSVESWLSNELPQIVASELDGMVERLRVQTLAHMRATLVPALSEKLSEILDSSLNTDGPR